MARLILVNLAAGIIGVIAGMFLLSLVLGVDDMLADRAAKASLGTGPVLIRLDPALDNYWVTIGHLEECTSPQEYP